MTRRGGHPPWQLARYSATVVAVRFDDDLKALAARQHSLVARPQMRDVGMSSTEASRAARSGVWEPVGGHVLRLVGSAPSDGQRLLIPVLDQGHDAALAYLTGAWWWGLKGCSERPHTLVTTSASSRQTDLARVRRIRSLPPRWSVVLQDVPVVRPELLAVQLFVVCSFDRADLLVDRLWAKRLLSKPSIERFLADMGRSGRNGITPLRQYLERRPPDYVPPATGLEGRVQQILGTHGIELRSQIDSGAEFWTGRVDFRHPELPVIIEVQSEAFHKALTDVEHDERRHEQLVRDGFVYREVWDTAVFADPRSVVDEVKGAIAEALGIL